MTMQLVDDYRKLIPHFTTKLAMELQVRLKVRILEDRPRGVSYTPAEADKLAGEIVSAMYRTQIREALAVVSFSDAIIKYNQPRLDVANDRADSLLGKRAAHLSRTFRNRKREVPDGSGLPPRA